MNDFDEYIRNGTPSQQEKAQLWRTSIGLQQVDGLTTSSFLRQLAIRHIEGEITMDELQSLLDEYYKQKRK